MNTFYMHTDPDVYPDPFTFDPERWMGEVTPEMKRNYVPFTRGSRSCPGMA
jgi:cytochrome P450